MIKNLKIRRRILSVLTSISVITSACFVNVNLNKTVYAAENQDIGELPPNIALDKKDFDTLPSMIKRFEDMDSNRVVWQIPANGEKKIQRVNFEEWGMDTQKEIPKDGLVIELPEDVTRVLRFFSDVRFEGNIKSLDDMTIIRPDGHEVSWHVAGTWKDKFTGLPTYYTKIDWLDFNAGFIDPLKTTKEGEEVNYKGYKLIVNGEGTLKDMYLWDEHGMSLIYDITGYTVLGGDKDILDSKVTVDTTKNLSINGTNKVDESAFKRYHTNSGPTQLSDNEDASISLLDKSYIRMQNEYGFLPGRGGFQFPLLSVPEASELPEDKTKPGYADYTLINKNYQKNQAQIDKMNQLYPTIKDDYMVVFDRWPSYMNTNPSDKAYGTPLLNRFESAAELAGKSAGALKTKYEGNAPKYIEVKNESTIGMEWTYHNTDPENSWDYLTQFHNKVYDQIKKETPETEVGGPCSAFMYLEKNNFSEAEKQLDFMSDTKNTLEYYCHHFYENNNLVVRDQGINPDGFLAGRLEAVFGLLGNYMTRTDNVKPILVSEVGNYNTGTTDIDYFINLKSYNGYMLRFLNQADKVDMLVPYLYPLINWKPDANNTFFKYNESKTDIAGTGPLIAYADMWKDYRGMFIPSSTDNSEIYTNAVRDGNKVFIAYENTSNQRVNLDLDIMLGDSKVVKASRKHNYLEKGKLFYEDEELDINNLSDIYTRVEETGVIEIELEDDKDFDGTVLRKELYGDKELVDTGKIANFGIKADTNNLSKSILRVCYGRTGKGFDCDMTVKINGKTYTKDLRDTNKEGDLWTYADFEVPTELIKENNNISVLIPEGANVDSNGKKTNVGKITNVQLINDYTQEAPKKGVDTTELINKVNESKELLNSVKKSKDGLDVAAGQKWVNADIADCFNFAIETVERVSLDKYATEEECKEAENTIKSAIDNFNKAIKIAVDAKVTFPHVSFEDGEKIEYSIAGNNKATTNIVKDNGVTDGKNALEVNISELNKTANGPYSLLKFERPGDFYSFGVGNPLKFNLTNPNDYPIQIRVVITDVNGVAPTYYFPVKPNSTREATIEQFSQHENYWGEDGYYGLVGAGLNTTKIKSVSFCIWEGNDSKGDQNLVNNDDITSSSFIVDNIRIDNGQTSIEPEAPTVSSIALDQSSKELILGDENSDSIKLNASVIMSDNSEYKGKLTWTSSNDKVATVDKEGNVKAVQEGTAVITVVTDNGKKAECTITVVKKSVDPSEPNKPVDPENPEDPSEPNKPVNPENPEDPSEPTKPTNPENPNDSSKPSQSTKPQEIPETGSEFMVSPFIIMGIMCLAGGCSIVLYNKKRKLNK